MYMHKLERSDIMRIRNVKNAKQILEETPYCYTVLPEKGHRFFSNDHPIHLEIGMGKGTFLYEMAKAFPEINFIGIERYDSILVRAIEKIGEGLPNLKIIRMDALEVASIFDHSIDVIYLNFSDPWPKARHAKRRLTSEVFLQEYDKVFKGRATIQMKTDNDGLFESSICSLSTYGYHFEEVLLDLSRTDHFNIPTEYESKFRSMGMPIHYLKAIK